MTTSLHRGQREEYVNNLGKLFHNSYFDIIVLNRFENRFRYCMLQAPAMQSSLCDPTANMPPKKWTFTSRGYCVRNTSELTIKIVPPQYWSTPSFQQLHTILWEFSLLPGQCMQNFEFFHVISAYGRNRGVVDILVTEGSFYLRFIWWPGTLLVMPVSLIPQRPQGSHYWFRLSA
jgi:hypothetical protein